MLVHAYAMRGGRPMKGAARALLDGVNDFVCEHAAAAGMLRRVFAGSEDEVRTEGEGARVVALSEAFGGAPGVNPQCGEIEAEGGFERKTDRIR